MYKENTIPEIKSQNPRESYGPYTVKWHLCLKHVTDAFCKYNVVTVYNHCKLNFTQKREAK